MNIATKPFRKESRWPVICSILFVLLILTLSRARIHLFPVWLGFLNGFGLILPMVMVSIRSTDKNWLRIEKFTTLFFGVFSEFLALFTMLYLINEMLVRPLEISGRLLLASSIGGWFTNVLTFSLLYWQLDRGGPGARSNHEYMKPDWLFPQTGVPDNAPADWRPTYIDYLFLAFSTATAFSTTEVAPLTSRAKVLMMIQAGISLMILVIVASRAINLLGN